MWSADSFVLFATIVEFLPFKNETKWAKTQNRLLAASKTGTDYTIQLPDTNYLLK
jgi:hypothetical protein